MVKFETCNTGAMKKFFLFICCSLLLTATFAQTISQKIAKAFKEFETDSQLRHAISSLYVINAKTHKVVFDKNSRVGLAAASTQKIITAATAFEILGKNYKYKTELGYDGKMNDGTVEGNLFIIGNGDPSFGSWRRVNTRPGSIIGEFVKAVKENKIRFFRDSYNFGITHFDDRFIPDGWIWQDVGNYYGAGYGALNWRENQFDIILESANEIGRLVNIVRTEPNLSAFTMRSEARSAAAGTGDNAYVYLPFKGQNMLVVRGTIPINEKSFRISGTIPDPLNEFFSSFRDSLLFNKISFGFRNQNNIAHVNGDELKKRPGAKIIYTHHSPSLDSIIYWFLQKSINLYGEALINTFAYEKNGFGLADSGIAIVRNFWKSKGLDEEELNIYDGSGLSPLNRVTTHAQVEILKYAKRQDWFPFFYNALPTFNGMKMKSGTISDVKGYCGYHKARDGNEYIFSFLVNNYNGRSSTLVNKMFKVLDVLK
jgi:serine-type D-Ala-D-Ala carboxypeptidase/endopeptidase (penicillin-binding protein 4)